MSDGFVYFLAPPCLSLVKIGHTNNPGKRLEALQSASPLPLQMHAVIDGDTRLEKAIHYHFRDWHHHAEWFTAHPELIALVAALARGEECPAFPLPTEKWALYHQALRGVPSDVLLERRREFTAGAHAANRQYAERRRAARAAGAAA